MKETNIQWLGQIPDAWQVRKGSTLYRINTGKLDVNAEDPNGDYPFFTCSFAPRRISTYAFDCEALLVAGNGMVGFTQYFKGKFNAYQRTYVLSNFIDAEPKFLKHYVSNNLALEVAPKAVGSVIQFIKLGDLKNFNIALPSKDEQKKIAEFLDIKCNRIDLLIDNINTQIKKLNEYKDSIIFEKIKYGLEPKNIKDSNIPWLKTINATFKTQPINSLFAIKKEIIGKKPEQVLSITQKGIIPKDINVNSGQMASSYDNYQKVEIGDFAMNHMDLLTGGVDVSKYNGVTSPDYRVFVLRDKTMIADYFLYQFIAFYKFKIFYAFGQGAANLGRWRLPASNFKRIDIVVPPIEEQLKIVEYLNDRCFKLDRLIELRQKQIERLTTYKKSLVYEYTTGKKRLV